ncbi:hypothetical protein [Pseudoxanthomonas koreensis]|uniref:hypothetical protein n=1 Tax=Pseudoxanthomonas koreensis TaxID=266061 RepID=UPI001390DB43|nr:hypothetical protein [Pseudoxanthomonas koreensis]KAF1696653.1 hypothetical protein CSC64_02040 [Pseudoxanthomonas koreensis]
MDKRIARLALAGIVAVAGITAAAAVTLEDMKHFESLYGRYGPKGDCSKYPQVVIDAAGFALDQGQGKVERANRPEYSASFFGPEYEGISGAFWPYWNDAGGNPFVVFTNYDEKPGALVVEPHDFGWKGGPAMPARYQPWLQGSPYARCAKA